MINIADFALSGLAAAICQGARQGSAKLLHPHSARHITPARLQDILAPYQRNGLLPHYPFGTELTGQEVALGASLRKIKSLSEEPGQFVAAAFRALLHRADPEAAKPFLERLQLEHPETTSDFLMQQLLLLELEERGLLKVS